jgi:hypothetical protein
MNELEQQHEHRHEQRGWVSVYGSAKSPKVSVRVLAGEARADVMERTRLALEAYHAALDGARQRAAPVDAPDPDAPIDWGAAGGA